MPKGRHRHPDTLSAPAAEWVRDAWLTIWHTLAGAPMPRTVTAATTVPQPQPFDADR